MAVQQSFSQRYELYSRLILQPFSRNLQSDLSINLNKSVPSLPQKPTQLETDDQWEALHYSIFGLEIQPYAGAYLHPKGLVGGDQTERALQLCTELGIKIDLTADSIEHLGRQLQLLSMLTKSNVHNITALQLLDELLLPWLPVILVAIQRYGQPFYSDLSQEIWQLIDEHRQYFEKPLSTSSPKKEGLLSDPKTGLKQVAQYLLTPVRCGCYLSRSSIGSIARDLSLPRGFGSRYQMLESLLFSAVDQELIPSLMDRIKKEIADWEKQYISLEVEAEKLAPSLGGWKKRIAFTSQVLEDVRKAVPSAS
jgi:putative dimethyl sulfoxide reductase chaperone